MLGLQVGRVDHGEVMAYLAGFCDIVRVVVTEGIYAMPIGKGFVPMLDGVSVGIDHLNQTIVAQKNHVTHLIAFGERGMGGHDEAAMFSQLVDHVLLHVEVLHEGEVGPIHFFSAYADLVCLTDEAITVFVGGDVVFSFIAMVVDAHIVRDAIVVVTQSLIHAIDGVFLALSAVGQTKILA